MKLAKSKENEIDDINLFFRELSWLADALNMSDFSNTDLDEDFELLSKFDKDPEIFIEDVAKHTKHQRIYAGWQSYNLDETDRSRRRNRYRKHVRQPWQSTAHIPRRSFFSHGDKG